MDWVYWMVRLESVFLWVYWLRGCMRWVGLFYLCIR